jgi:septal ring factor EnvC (AmiA/AmiB activator)
MRRAFALAAVAAVLACGALVTVPGAGARRAVAFQGSAETRAALAAALAARRAAEARSAQYEREAKSASDAVERTAREAAAVAARIQQAEAGIAAAEARIALAARERAALREQLGHEQQPVMHLTAALQQFSRRPVALSLLRTGSVEDVVHLRALLDSAVPQVRARTADLRARLARSRELHEESLAATAFLRSEETRLAERRRELAALEARQREASREARALAVREAERALALAEEARDLDALIAELDRAAALRIRLAALPGPVPRRRCLTCCRSTDVPCGASAMAEASPRAAG